MSNESAVHKHDEKHHPSTTVSKREVDVAAEYDTGAPPSPEDALRLRYVAIFRMCFVAHPLFLQA